MLRYNGKKINAAFHRLRDRRVAVGIVSTAETPEQEAKRVQQEMSHAAETGDISTMLRLIAQSSTLTPADFIKKTVGNILFLYYSYLKQFHARPVDLIDMVDGLLFMDASNYIQEQSMKGQQK